MGTKRCSAIAILVAACGGQADLGPDAAGPIEVAWQLTGPTVPEGSTYGVLAFLQPRGDDGGAPLLGARSGPVAADGRFAIELPAPDDVIDPADLTERPLFYFFVHVDTDGDGQICPDDLVGADNYTPTGPEVYEVIPPLITLPMRVLDATWTCRPLPM